MTHNLHPPLAASGAPVALDVPVAPNIADGAEAPTAEAPRTEAPTSEAPTMEAPNPSPHVLGPPILEKCAFPLRGGHMGVLKISLTWRWLSVRAAVFTAHSCIKGCDRIYWHTVRWPPHSHGCAREWGSRRQSICVFQDHVKRARRFTPLTPENDFQFHFRFIRALPPY